MPLSIDYGLLFPRWKLLSFFAHENSIFQRLETLRKTTLILQLISVQHSKAYTAADKKDFAVLNYIGNGILMHIRNGVKWLRSSAHQLSLTILEIPSSNIRKVTPYISNGPRTSAVSVATIPVTSIRVTVLTFVFRASLHVSSANGVRRPHCKDIRISTDILWRVFHILTEPVPYMFAPVNRQNNEGRATSQCGPALHYFSLDSAV